MKQQTKVSIFFLALVIVYVAISFGMNIVFPELELSLSASILIPQLIILLFGIGYLVISRTKISQLIPYKKIKISTFFMLILCTYLMLPLTAVINALSLLFTYSGTSGLNVMIQDTPFLLTTFLVAILPACVEEFLFRGILYHTYRKSSITFAMIISAFLFGCLHMNLNQFCYTLVFGIYLVLVIEATGSILASMTCHFIMNFNSVCLMYLMGKFQQWLGGTGFEATSDYAAALAQTPQIEMEGMIVAIGFWALIAVVTTALGVCVYIWICKNCNRLEHVKNMFKRKSEESIISIPMILAVIICFVVMLVM